MAVRKANVSGGLNGHPVRLIVRSMEGHWGTGSKQAVTMIFDENVVAILGSHDGRNAHLVEQVSAKSRVVFLSAWSGDPTLSQAFVPWFFNCVYNDLQLADALIEEVYDRRKYVKIAVISDNSYDSESTMKNFLKKAESEGKPEPMKISYNDTSQDFKTISEKLKTADISCIILFVQPPASLKITEQMKIDNIGWPVFGSLAQLDENKIARQDLRNYENVTFVSSGILAGNIGISFSEDYEKAYGNLPGAVAAHAYDGMNILLEAIRKGGTEHETLQRSIAEIKYEGVTGLIKFDDNGNRRGKPGLVIIKNGIPVTLK